MQSAKQELRGRVLWLFRVLASEPLQLGAGLGCAGRGGGSQQGCRQARASGLTRVRASPDLKKKHRGNSWPRSAMSKHSRDWGKGAESER